MTDTELLKSLRAALELARFAEVNIELTPDELAWLLDRAEKYIRSIGTIRYVGRAEPLIYFGDEEFDIDDIDIADAVLTDEAEE